MRKDADNACANKDFTKLNIGGTYNPIEVEMSYQRENKENTISIFIPGVTDNVVFMLNVIDHIISIHVRKSAMLVGKLSPSQFFLTELVYVFGSFGRLYVY